MRPSPSPRPLPFRITLLATLLSCLCGLPWAVAPALAENWPHWRGPQLDGTSAETGLATEWGGEEGKNVLWRHELPGFAASSPIAWEDRIIVTSTQEGSDALLVRAVDRQGKELWTTEADSGSVEVFAQFAHETNAAASSPVTDGERIYALFGTARLVALDMDGKELWKVDLAERYGAPGLYFGISTSPLVRDGRLYLLWLHADGQWILALDAATGAPAWKHERSTDAEKESLHAYTSLLPFAPGGEGAGGDGAEQLLVHGADYTSGHRFEDGAEIWRYGTLNPKEGYNPMFRLVATPAIADGLVVVPTAKRGPVFALRPGAGKGAFGEGDPRVAWKLDKGTPDVPSPVIGDGLVYLVGETGTLVVLDAATGEEHYAERVHQGPHRGSPVLADGKLYLSGTDGTVSVVKAGPKYELLAQNSLDSGDSNNGRLAASPAVSEGVIYLRTEKALFAIGTPSPPE